MVKYGFRIALLITIAAFGILGCGSSNTVSNSSEIVTIGDDVKGEVIPAAELSEGSRAKMLGRTFLENDVLWFDYTMSGIEFDLRGECTVCFESDWVDEEDYHAYVGCFINDKEQEELRIEIDGSKNVTVCNTGNNPMKVKFVKLSEAKRGTVGISEIHFSNDSEIMATPSKKLFFEFIGDSITCGMGNEGSPLVNFTTATENGAKSFAALVGNYFDADISCICYSGIGMIRHESENYTFCIPEMYQYSRLLPEWGGVRKECVYIPGRKPNLIVINAGTNDSKLIQGNLDMQHQFEDVYGNFIDDLLANNPETYIICCVGPMNYDAVSLVENIVDIKNSDRLFFMLFPEEDEEGVGVSGHPSCRTHENMAKRLERCIEDNCVWE